jgi:hypothetical protein
MQRRQGDAQEQLQYDVGRVDALYHLYATQRRGVRPLELSRFRISSCTKQFSACLKRPCSAIGISFL